MVPLPLNSKHQETLVQIFGNPVPRHLEWRKVALLLLAVGCQERKPYQVRDVRAYLELLEIKP